MRFLNCKLSGTCDGGLEKSSFLSFSWSWSLLCLKGAVWIVVGCAWEVAGSPADVWQADFPSLSWAASLGYKGANRLQREQKGKFSRFAHYLRKNSTIHHYTPHNTGCRQCSIRLLAAHNVSTFPITMEQKKRLSLGWLLALFCLHLPGLETSRSSTAGFFQECDGLVRGM